MSVNRTNSKTKVVVFPAIDIIGTGVATQPVCLGRMKAENIRADSKNSVDGEGQCAGVHDKQQAVVHTVVEAE